MNIFTLRAAEGLDRKSCRVTVEMNAFLGSMVHAFLVSVPVLHVVSLTRCSSDFLRFTNGLVGVAFKLKMQVYSVVLITSIII